MDMQSPSDRNAQACEPVVTNHTVSDTEHISLQSAIITNARNATFDNCGRVNVSTYLLNELHHTAICHHSFYYV